MRDPWCVSGGTLRAMSVHGSVLVARLLASLVGVALFTLLACGDDRDDGGSGGIGPGDGGGSGDDGSSTGDGGSGDGGGTGDGGGSEDDGGTGDDGGTDGGGTGDGGSGDDGGVDPEMPVCWTTCATPADCVISPGGSWDEDNYACEDERCVYTGCNGDAECQGTGSYVCREIATGVPYCVMACQTADDCSLGAPDFDADNYACDSGACIYQGCNSDAECQEKGAYVCRDYAGGLLPGFEGVPTCVPTCDTSDDCDLGAGPAYDADNHDCTDGACVWTGCNGDDECGQGQVCE